MKLITLPTLIWLIAFLFLAIAGSFLNLGAVLLWMVLIIYTVVFSAVQLYKAVRAKQLSALYPVALIASVFFLWSATPLRNASDYLRLSLEESNYRKVIEAASSGNNSPCERLNCIVGDIDKKQVAFVWSGLMNGWSGVCHDPTGAIMRANIRKKDGSNSSVPEFGNTMTNASHLKGNWYLCSFI